MLEKIGQSAETLVSRVSVSRRGFLGRLGRGAALLGGMLGGILLTSGTAEAGPLCCMVWTGQGASFKCYMGRCKRGGTTVYCRDYGCPF